MMDLTTLTPRLLKINLLTVLLNNPKMTILIIRHNLGTAICMAHTSTQTPLTTGPTISHHHKTACDTWVHKFYFLCILIKSCFF